MKSSFVDRVRAAIEECKANVASFRELPENDSFEEVVLRFDRMLQPLNGLAGRVGLFIQVHPDAEMREACEGLEQEIAALRTDLSLDRGIYDRLAALDLADANGPEAKRLLEHALRDFRRAGVSRDEETRSRIRDLQKELVKIGQDFERNIITGGRDFVVEDGHAGLEGLPEDFLAAHPEREDGTVLLNTDPTDRIPFLTYAERDDLRRDYFLQCMNRAVPDNLEVLPRLLAKRHELATLLGYDHWADYVTEDKMSGSAEEVRGFIERVIDLVRDRGRAENDELLEKKKEVRDASAGFVWEWERGFLVEKVKSEKYGFDSLSVRPYFAYDKVKAGVLATTAALYGVEFRRNEDVELWHESVECYDIVDAGEVVARFYLDMHPRKNKYKHAAMFHVSEGLEDEVLAECALVCNFPEVTKDDPGLLMHDQVTTFFHEFGHLLHHLFAGRSRWMSFSGISTEHDFVEVPSQMYEEWAWDSDVLATFATHHETGEPIPADVVATMRAAEEYGKSIGVLGQMVFASLSLAYYDRDPANVDLGATMKRIRNELLPTKFQEGNNFHASFGHLHGYSAMYYTYMWSLVIAKDLFGRFDGDLMNGATANDYRKTVLAPGGSKDARELIEGFLGRDYAFEAFEKWLSR